MGGDSEGRGGSATEEALAVGAGEGSADVVAPLAVLEAPSFTSANVAAAPITAIEVTATSTVLAARDPGRSVSPTEAAALARTATISL